MGQASAATSPAAAPQPVSEVALQRILLWGSYDLGKPRTRILRDRVDALMVKAGSLTTVGPGGDFGNLTDALAYLSERRPAYAPGGFITEVRLLTGYQMAEQVLVSGANLGWLTITSEAAEVIKLAPTMGRDKIILVNLSGRGDKDIFTVADVLGINI